MTLRAFWLFCPIMRLQLLDGLMGAVAGCILLALTGCAPRLHTAAEGELQALDPTSLHPLTGCYNYIGTSLNCRGPDCPAPFFPFADGPASPSGGPSKSNSGEADRERPDTVCLRADEGRSVRATAYRQGEAITSQRYKGTVRSDGYFTLGTSTGADATRSMVFWVLHNSRAALAVDSTGALKQVELRTSSLFLVLLPVFGTNVGASARFDRATDPHTP
jgi:hypothetical protein